jgi:hypothetical protein
MGRVAYTRHVLRFACLALLTACTSGAPPGFSGGLGGDRWTLPLVGPLENGQLLTAVTINTHGPYLFAIDPDAPMSLVDASVVKALELRTRTGPKRLDETDTQQTRLYAELNGLEIGSLIVEQRDAIIVRTGMFDTVGRRVVGVLGRDVFADSVAWGFDRDNGVAYMVTQKLFKPPPDAQPIIYAELPSRVTNAQVVPPPRRLVDATINGEKVTMHVDLGAAASQLRDSEWERMKLVPRELKAVVIDEVGEGRLITKASEAPVTLGSITNDRVPFIPYGDSRWPSEELAGTLGLSFFANHDVWQSWHTKQYFVVPRRPVTAAARIGRWDSAVLSRCKVTGCVTIRVTDPLAGKPPLEEGKTHPGLILSITRDAIAGGMGLEVVLEATNAPSLPRLLVNMPGHVDKLLYQLPAAFLDTTLEVVDASPFPRDCPSPNGCVDQLAR